ncbi:hypothetical protein O5559_28070, partial [Escherichia coli]|nr:hypothetical protein [Escherichia coli]
MKAFDKVLENSQMIARSATILGITVIGEDTHHAQGPGKSVLGIGQRIVSI